MGSLSDGVNRSGMSETCTLYPYQNLKYRELLAYIQAGEQDLLAYMPPSSGKTKMLQYLLGELQAAERFSTILVVVPLLTIKSAWLRPIQLNTLHGEPVIFKAQEALPRELGTASFWQRRPSRIYVTSRASVVTKSVLDLLRNQRPDCQRVLVLCDEGHHHVEEETKAGTFCQLIQSLGGVALRSTGTPWHSQGEVLTEKTRVVRLSAAEYARQTDPKTGTPLAPQNWEFRRVMVPVQTSDLNLALERNRRGKTKFPTDLREKTIKAVVEKWVGDGCPKAIINVPRIEGWASPLLAEIKKSTKAKKTLGHIPWVHNFTGKKNKEEKKAMEEVLQREYEAKNWEDSRVDLIVSCARMEEGTDWAFCSHVYNVRMPNSPRQIIQRWARAGRSKRRILGYPEKWTNIQSMTCFMPLLSEEAKEQMWKEHRDVALLMACFLEDYETAQQWISESPKLDRFSKLYNSRAPKKQLEAARAQALEESTFNDAIAGDDFCRAEAWAEILRLTTSQPGMSFGKLWGMVEEKLQKAKPKTKAALLSALLSHLKMQNREIYDHLRKALQQRPWKRGESLIREGMQEVFDQIAAKFEHLIVPSPKHMLERIAQFTAFDAEEVADLLHRRVRGYPFSITEIQKEAEKYLEATGSYPTCDSGSWPGFSQARWSTADNWLKRNTEFTLSSLLRAKDEFTLEGIRNQGSLFFETHHKFPNCESGVWEGFQGRTWGAADRFLREKCNSSLSLLFRGRSGTPPASPQKKLQEVLRFWEKHGHKPRQENTPVYGYLVWLWRHDYRLPEGLKNERPRLSPQERALEIAEHIKKTGSTPNAVLHKTLYSRWKVLRDEHPDLLRKLGIPLRGDKTAPIKIGAGV
jgi:superfamily II DNA or RNA helicase